MTISIQCKSSLESAINDMLSETKLDSNYTCDKCRQKSKAKISNDFVKLPRTLILHVKRFDSSFTKLNKNLSYPSKLNMRQFVSSETDMRLLGSTEYAL